MAKKVERMDNGLHLQTQAGVLELVEITAKSFCILPNGVPGSWFMRFRYFFSFDRVAALLGWWLERFLIW